MAGDLTTKITLAAILGFEVVMIIVYGVFIQYDVATYNGFKKIEPESRHESEETTMVYIHDGPQAMQQNENAERENIVDGSKSTRLQAPEGDYDKFMNVQVMVFIGFGFLMTFLRRYARSSLGFGLLFSCVVIQLFILLDGVIDIVKNLVYLKQNSLIRADLAAAAFLITYGAVLGKLTPLQLFFVAFVETGFYTVNLYVTEEFYKVRDVGGSMLIHQFGAYFGLAVSLMIGLKMGIQKEKNSFEKSSYRSDVSSIIGTLFLWVFWPSFNGVMVDSSEFNVVLFNTYLSLTASTLTALAVSVAVSKNWKFSVFHAQNATLAGGVMIGSLCNLNIHPVGALMVGSFAGALSVVGYRWVRDPVHKILRIHDTCGVHYLHGIPGLLGGLIACLFAFFSTEDLYGPNLGTTYPERVRWPKPRTAVMEGVYHLATWGTTLVLALIGGIASGAFVVFLFPNVEFGDRFNDELWWEDEDDEPA